MRHMQAGILTQAFSAAPAFPASPPVASEDRSANTATALCGILTRFPFDKPAYPCDSLFLLSPAR
ncbi:hypothetical protein BACCAP_01555 [Pseudoflavonifractor capillosus ATCC 29799]|uniref:Uncharacterized protein n=1 Tax=Pseudoflavonifractor capillosus ATCC 29799 TaxID=411467 RepID=A6NTM6_9FIRM|nr:hypothetical protein BACCAP_01555 [Pseudoflavonifractor capillosus ATCC 29799]